MESSEGVPGKSPLEKIQAKANHLMTTIPKSIQDYARRHTTESKVKEMQRQVLLNLRLLRDTYGIRVHMHGLEEDEATKGITSLEKLNLFEANELISALIQETVKYPPEFFKYVDLKSLRLVKSMRINQDYKFGEKRDFHIGGLAAGLEKKIYVTPASREATGDLMIEYAISKLPGSTRAAINLSDFRRVFHHELFHKGEYRMYENIQGWSTADTYFSRLDENWASLNPTGDAVYLRENYDQQKYTVPLQPDGFVNNYAMSSETEDRASTAEMLMMYPKELAKRMEKEPVLASKVKKVANEFWQWSGGRMDLNWLDSQLAGKTGTNYFKSRGHP